jgi:hypothetical protein
MSSISWYFSLKNHAEISQSPRPKPKILNLIQSDLDTITTRLYTTRTSVIRGFSQKVGTPNYFYYFYLF